MSTHAFNQYRPSFIPPTPPTSVRACGCFPTCRVHPPLSIRLRTDRRADRRPRRARRSFPIQAGERVRVFGVVVGRVDTIVALCSCELGAL